MKRFVPAFFILYALAAWAGTWRWSQTYGLNPPSDAGVGPMSPLTGSATSTVCTGQPSPADPNCGVNVSGATKCRVCVGMLGQQSDGGKPRLTTATGSLVAQVYDYEPNQNGVPGVGARWKTPPAADSLSLPAASQGVQDFCWAVVTDFYPEGRMYWYPSGVVYDAGAEDTTRVALSDGGTFDGGLAMQVSAECYFPGMGHQ